MTTTGLARSRLRKRSAVPFATASRNLHELGISDMLIRLLATLGTPFVLLAALFDASDRRGS